MQIASKQCLWTDGIKGTVVEVEMTPTTGKYLKFISDLTTNTPLTVSWGDGTKDEQAFRTGEVNYAHTYADYGKYKIVINGIRSLGFRSLDGQAQCQYDGCVLSIVDYVKQIQSHRSAAFKRAVNLETYIAEGCKSMGQRDFAYCTKLKTVHIGECGIYYDGTFQGCTALVDFQTQRSWTCWSYVWQNCTALTELRLGDVNQFATQDFSGCTNLQDIWIANKTVDQIKQVASSGNIVAGYGARFPWGAPSTCRFHGTDGIVLGNGTRVS